VTGNAAATDPVCPKSPDRHLIDEAIKGAVLGSHEPAAQPLKFVPGAARSGSLWYRTDANSRTLTGAHDTTDPVGEPA